jgi:hypothetical protein
MTDPPVIPVIDEALLHVLGVMGRQQIPFVSLSLLWSSYEKEWYVSLSVSGSRNFDAAGSALGLDLAETVGRSLTRRGIAYGVPVSLYLAGRQQDTPPPKPDPKVRARPRQHYTGSATPTGVDTGDLLDLVASAEAGQ